MKSFLQRLLPAPLLALALTPAAHAITVKISGEALERTLLAQLFTAPEARYYIKGDPASPCFVFAEQPRVSFNNDRVVVHVHARARLGQSLRGACLGSPSPPTPTSPSSPKPKAKPSASATPASKNSPTPANSTSSSRPSSAASCPSR